MGDIATAQTLVNRGFDIIAGHGPHLVQPAHLLTRGREAGGGNAGTSGARVGVVFPSLGNFVPSGATGGPALCGGAYIVKAGLDKDKDQTLLPLAYRFEGFATLQNNAGLPFMVPLRSGFATSDALEMCSGYFDNIFDAGKKKRKVPVFRRTRKRRDLHGAAASIEDRVGR